MVTEAFELIQTPLPTFPPALCDTHAALEQINRIVRLNPTSRVNCILREIANDEMAAHTNFQATCPACRYQQAEQDLAGKPLPADMDEHEPLGLSYWDTEKAMQAATSW